MKYYTFIALFYVKNLLITPELSWLGIFTCSKIRMIIDLCMMNDKTMNQINKKCWRVLLFWKGAQTYNEVCSIDVDTTAQKTAPRKWTRISLSPLRRGRSGTSLQRVSPIEREMIADKLPAVRFYTQEKRNKIV